MRTLLVTNLQFNSRKSNPCTGGKYAAGTEVTMRLKTGTKAVLKAFFSTVECTESEIKGKTSSSGGSGVTISVQVANFRFGSCNCVVTTVKPGTVEVHYTANDDATLTNKDSEVTVTCSGVSCIFGSTSGGTDIGTMTGGNPATLATNDPIPWIAGDSPNFVCTAGGGTANWLSTYEVVAPEPLFIEGS